MSDLSWMRPKLAELCGMTLFSPVPELEGVYAITGQDDPDSMVSYRYWRPDQNVAQAMACFQIIPGFCCKEIRMPVHEGWEILFRSEMSEHKGAPDVAIYQQESLPRAICLAIAAALGWEKE